MPITYGDYTKLVKSLPLTLNADGTAKLTMRFFYKNNITNEETPAEQTTYDFTAQQVSDILDTYPITGLTRRDDLAISMYQYLVQHGFMDAGVIT